MSCPAAYTAHTPGAPACRRGQTCSVASVACYLEGFYLRAWALTAVHPDRFAMKPCAGRRRTGEEPVDAAGPELVK